MNKTFFRSIVITTMITIPALKTYGQGAVAGVTGTNIASSFGGFNGGIGTRLGGSRARFGFFAEQGSSLTLNSVSPSLTLWNGVPGSIQSGFVQPFVTGFTPVVSAQPISPVQIAIQQYGVDRIRATKTVPSRKARGPKQQRVSSSSTATQPDLSVAAIKKSVRTSKAQRVKTSRRLRPVLKLEEIHSTTGEKTRPDRNR